MDVLIVDDEREIREALERALTDEGYQVHQVADGAAALAYLKAQTAPHLILLDFMMPKLDGVSFLRTIYEHEDLPIPHKVILIPASDRQFLPQTREFLQEYGIPIMPKPFDLPTLLHAVAQDAARLM